VLEEIGEPHSSIRGMFGAWTGMDYLIIRLAVKPREGGKPGCPIGGGRVVGVGGGCLLGGWGVVGGGLLCFAAPFCFLYLKLSLLFCALLLHSKLPSTSLLREGRRSLM